MPDIVVIKPIYQLMPFAIYIEANMFFLGGPEQKRTITIMGLIVSLGLFERS